MLAQAAQTFTFDITAKTADEALTEFARQADTTLLFSYDLAQQVTANSLTGTYTLKEGLAALLKGTELAVDVDARGMLTVKHISEIRQPAPTPAALKEDDSVPAVTLERIAIVGSRSSPRSVIESAVPLDILGPDNFRGQGSSDLLSMLSATIPSLNVSDQPINDASSMVRPANLRGMASDHTLLLLNGKRRHRSAVITFLGGGLSDGAQGPDISVLPAYAIEQVEVLRDGAAAQYGSDAIAGVINFVLKDDAEGGGVAVQAGQYSHGDGDAFQLQGNLGLALTNHGFANLTVEYRQQQATSRSVQRDDATTLIEAGNEFVASPAQVWGALNVEYDVKGAANVGVELNQQHQWYAFANLARRKVQGGFYFRHPHFREGVFSRSTDAGLELLVADLDGLGQGISCPQVMITSDNVLNQPDYQRIAADDAVGQNCFAFNEILPGGFRPKFGGVVEDAAVTTGISGSLPHHLEYDLSGTVGYSHIEYTLSDTLNPSLGPASPTAFSPGAVSQVERTVNLDFSKPVQTHWYGPLNLGFGVEWRRETYHQRAGDAASWQVGEFAFNNTNGLSQGFSIGSNGFPGYQPQSAGHWSRHNWALYADGESRLTERFSLAAALRTEQFSDFGSTYDGKLSVRYQASDLLALRSSLSTGFKAPTVGQSNVINVTTAYAAGGLEDQATLPPDSLISRQLGASPLTPEQSVNMSVGLVAFWDADFYFTLDYFNIRLNDRISTTSAIPLDDEDIEALVALGQSDAGRYSSAKYFTNDFDTRTQGLDFVLHYRLALGEVLNELSVAYNWTDTQVEQVSRYPVTDEQGQVTLRANLTDARIRMLEDNLPAHRATITLKQYFDDVTLLWRGNYYGSFYEDHLDASAGLDIYGGAMVTLDAEFSYMVSDQLSVSVGGRNLLNSYPDENPYQQLVGAQYPTTAPAGINGGFYYAEARYSF